MTNDVRRAVICLCLLFAAVSAFAAGPKSDLPEFLLVFEPSPQGTCSATCGDMGTGPVSVSCNGTCTIVDQDCDSGVRGYVKCNATQVQSDCPVCEWCTASTSCPEGGYLGCGTWGYPYNGSTGCEGQEGTCFVRCDNQWQWCPGHVGQILCSW